MVQLSALLASQVFYGTIGLVFVGLYGIAIRCQWNSQLAPRSANRPKSIIHNVLRTQPTVGCCCIIYPISFLCWAWRLTFPQGLQGIEGTGSRNNGWAGPTLKWNVDGVILLKYHMLLLKIAMLATILCLFILLPTFATADCDPQLMGMQTCKTMWNLTDFENMTIMHIPDKVWRPNNQTTTIVLENGTVIEIPPPTVNPILGKLWVPGVSSRTLVVVVCCVILYVYTCRLLWYEWIDNLALRRIYFLEADHYSRRIKELDEITAIQNIIPPDQAQKDRPPYIPDPELRDTPPSVGLYSVLYQLPESLVTYDTDGATQMERQVVATTNFFDECVPAQPGFSSSVVAVTIVPNASRVAKAWMKWYKVETKLRRLRFIRRMIQEKMEKEAEGITDIYDNIAGMMKKSKQGLENATHTVTSAVIATGRQLSEVSVTIPLSTTARQRTMSSLMDDETTKEQHDPKVDGEGVQLGLALDTGKSANIEAKTSDQAESTIDLVVHIKSGSGEKGQESSHDQKSDSNNEQNGGLSSSSNDDNNNVVVSLWSKWIGWIGNDENETKSKSGDPATDSKKRPLTLDDENHPSDIEMQPLKASFDDHSLSGESSEKGITTAKSVDLTSCSESPEVRDFFYQDFDVIEYAKKLGFDAETELVGIVDGLGIEELSIFAREYAQSSANPCVYGMSPQLLKFNSIEELQEMEEELWADLREANDELTEARKNAVAGDEDEDGLVSSGTIGNGHGEKVEADVTNSVIQAFSIDSGLRNRCSGTSTRDQWEMVQQAAAGMRLVPQSLAKHGTKSTRCGHRLLPCIGEKLTALPKYYGNQLQGAGKSFVTALDHPTYAVVTFTSRQAAIAARQSLADGGGVNTWKQVDDIPISPLADAPPRNLLFFRGCCRPVTMTINYKEKKVRRLSVIAFLFFFCCLYTIPLAFIQNLANPEFLARSFPDAEGLHDRYSQTYAFFAALSGPFSSLMLTLFFSFLPQLFKFLAFYDGTSSSMEKAERFALLLYWYFMLVTAFAGASLANMFFAWIEADFTAEESIRTLLNEIAGNLPGRIAPTWLNWIIMRYSFTWTAGYLFRMDAFITRALNMKWCNRIMRGGGPGAPTPYRLFVDSGVVFMCITALSPACPLVAPAALLYFLIVQPILRWLLIFVYRPKYDGGGDKWPQLHQIIISAMILGQILMAVNLSLKAAYWEGIFVGCCAIPTYFFHLLTLERFYRPYLDCALLQTSRLDSWQDSHSLKEREEYRRWLVDCHKASYVPLCLLGTKKNLLTAEPAVVIPRDSDEDLVDTVCARRQRLTRQSAQKGAIFNRKYM